MTGIGKVVGRLRNNRDTKVASRSGELVKRWKDQILAGKKGSTGQTASKASSTPNSRSSSSSASTTPRSSVARSTPIGNEGPVAPVPLTRSTSSSSSTGSSTPFGVRSIEADQVKFDGLGDRIRDKCVDLLYKALAVDATAGMLSGAA